MPKRYKSHFDDGVCSCLGFLVCYFVTSINTGRNRNSLISAFAVHSTESYVVYFFHADSEDNNNLIKQANLLANQQKYNAFGYTIQ